MIDICEHFTTEALMTIATVDDGKHCFKINKLYFLHETWDNLQANEKRGRKMTKITRVGESETINRFPFCVDIECCQFYIVFLCVCVQIHSYMRMHWLLMLCYVPVEFVMRCSSCFLCSEYKFRIQDKHSLVAICYCMFYWDVGIRLFNRKKTNNKMRKSHSRCSTFV